MRRASRRTMSRLSLAVVTALALAAPACGGSSTTPITPSVPPSNVTDTFTGTLTRNGATTFGFSSNSAGFVYAALTSIADTSLAVGLSLGTLNSTGGCNIIIANDSAMQGTTITGSVTAAG